MAYNLGMELCQAKFYGTDEYGTFIFASRESYVREKICWNDKLVYFWMRNHLNLIAGRYYDRL